MSHPTRTALALALALAAPGCAELPDEPQPTDTSAEVEDLVDMVAPDLDGLLDEIASVCRTTGCSEYCGGPPD
ncbi:MAG: hypothetical protein KBG48_13935 [Kofleriaceae bacterium]|jgi:hypothetical protein|nr:hypothetical protein [Kofleriaceae bacterium]MBP9168490.1 hypothetical protein [Kofleriaceae bacterium]